MFKPLSEKIIKIHLSLIMCNGGFTIKVTNGFVPQQQGENWQPFSLLIREKTTFPDISYCCTLLHTTHCSAKIFKGCHVNWTQWTF